LASERIERMISLKRRLAFLLGPFKIVCLTVDFSFVGFFITPSDFSFLVIVTVEEALDDYDSLVMYRKYFNID
jgi:hypothetical protein